MSMIPKFLTDDDNEFPDISQALSNPNGLLAIGGDLSVARLLTAYQHGIFPWYDQDQPILWWSPDPRAGLNPGDLTLPRSLKKILRHDDYRVTVDTAFEQVITCCAAPRRKQSETWIVPEMQSAYCHLHHEGIAHSIEVWRANQLIGGLYGVDCGLVFTGESMFSLESNAAKIAFVYLTRLLQTMGYLFLDCQIQSAFLKTFGVGLIPREQFETMLQAARPDPKRWLYLKGNHSRLLF